MATYVKNIDIEEVLSILDEEEEMIIKPFHSSIIDKIGAIERGKIVSRMNRVLFDYQIGGIGNLCTFNSIFSQRIILSDPETKEKVLELHYNRFPFLCKVSCKHAIRCVTSLSGESEPIGAIHQRLAFSKLWYDVYNSNHKHAISLILRKNYLLRKIQHCVPEFKILDKDEITDIGRIYPFSTDRQRSQYGHAVALKLSQDIDVELKATLLIAALVLKSRLK